MLARVAKTSRKFARAASCTCIVWRYCGQTETTTVLTPPRKIVRVDILVLNACLPASSVYAWFNLFSRLRPNVLIDEKNTRTNAVSWMMDGCRTPMHSVAVGATNAPAYYTDRVHGQGEEAGVQHRRDLLDAGTYNVRCHLISACVCVCVCVNFRLQPRRGNEASRGGGGAVDEVLSSWCRRHH